jgi:CubicO group peptidase (beta-lactamase class C family)
VFRKALSRSFTSILLVLICFAAASAFTQDQSSELSADVRGQIDKVAADVLAKTGVPSASVAVVKDGRIAYLHAYGNARLEPVTPATPQMRYSIGSISKQFTAAALLLLQEQGKLSLDDKVSKYFPGLTRANEITIRQLLSHTSGYQDYWPQDYVMPGMLKPVTAEQILDTWAKKPLDFDPGTKWQYSNTNFVIAGLIVEKASGMPFMQFVHEKILAPLGMKSVTDTDAAKLPPADPEGYIRYALGPARSAPKEGKGWMFAAGELAMTAEDLAKWDVSIIRRSLLKPPSYTQLETEVLLKNGLGTQYGLGVDVNSQFGHRAISHGGEVSGFTAENVVFPDDGVAVVVLTNQDAASAGSGIARGIAPLLFSVNDAETEVKLAQARKIFEGLQHGTIDRSLFTDNCNFYFNEQALKDFADSLGPLGTPQSFVQVRQALRGGMKLRVYAVRFPNKVLRAWTYEMPDGKLEQYLVAAQE